MLIILGLWALNGNSRLHCCMPYPTSLLQYSMILLISKQPLQKWFFLMLGAIGPYLSYFMQPMLHLLPFFFFNLKAHSFQSCLAGAIPSFDILLFPLGRLLFKFKIQFQVFQIPFFWSLLWFSQKNFDTFSSEDVHT